MKASELRIGNWIKDGNDFEQVTIDHLNCLNSGRCEFEPIPLTEEWLLKFGFLIDGEEYRLEGISIEDIHNGEKWCVCMFDEYHAVECSLALIQHVHQLQNLYFALTNEELTL